MYMSGGGSSGPTSTTVNQSNIPDWLRPQVETVLGGATKQLFNTQQSGVDAEGKPIYDITGTKPFVPYSTNMNDYVAGFSPLQRQAQSVAAQLQTPGQFQQGTQLANTAGAGGVNSAGQAYGYGGAGFQSGQTGQKLGVQGGQYYGNAGANYGNTGANLGIMGLGAQGLGNEVAGQARQYGQQSADAQSNYQQQATNPGTYQQYMSPYQQNVTDVQLAQAQRQADIASQGRKADFARAGAYGGARQAIENSEADRNLQSQLGAIQAQGLQNAFQNAQGNIQFGANLGIQGLQGAQQGLGTALQGGQLGLSGIDRSLTGQQLGIQGAQTGLQGVQQQLAGTQQGMQGAQTGLQGVTGAQQGYGLANQAAGTLGQLGAQQNASQMDILNFQNMLGAQQQAQQQAKINQSIQNYGQQQQAPITALNEYNALIRGYALPGTTTTQYQASPSTISQVAGLGTAAAGLSGLAGIGKKKGGKITAKKQGIDTLAMRRALAGA